MDKFENSNAFFNKNFANLEIDNPSMKTCLGILSEPINQLCELLYIFANNNDISVRIYRLATEILRKLISDFKTIASYELVINFLNNNIIHTFRNEYPNLKNEDYFLFLYLMLNFKSYTISILLNLKLSVVYNRKSRLKKFIRMGNSEYKELFLKYF